MPPRETTSDPLSASLAPRGLGMILLAVALLAFAARVLPQPRTIDDAFITFRYSRNLAAGDGFVYNLGTRTLGTTTPLYTIVMALIGGLTGSDAYPWFALFVNAAADGLTAALLALLLYRLTRQVALAAVIGALWAINATSVTFAVGGMETSVSILWGVAAVSAYVAGRDRWMAVFAALGILTRIDNVLWVGLLFAHQFLAVWWEHRRRLLERVPWRSWALFAALLAPWFVFSAVYFGTLVPRSLAAKRLAYHVGSMQAVTTLLHAVATPFFEDYLLGGLGVMAGIVLYPALAAVGTFYALKRQPRLVPYLIYPWLYVVVFSVANPLIFRWYLAPFIPAYYLAILLGIWALIESATVGVRRLWLRPALVAGIWVMLATFALSALTLTPDHRPDSPAPQMAWHKIELLYQDVGETLRRDYGTNAQTLVAAGDIGAVGYFSHARILDTVGLVTPEISAYYPIDPTLIPAGAVYAVPPAIIHDYAPDFVVLMEEFVRLGLARDRWFTATYDEIRVIPTDFYGEGMIVYRRRDLALVGE